MLNVEENFYLHFYYSELKEAKNKELAIGILQTFWQFSIGMSKRGEPSKNFDIALVSIQNMARTRRIEKRICFKSMNGKFLKNGIRFNLQAIIKMPHALNA